MATRSSGPDPEETAERGAIATPRGADAGLGHVFASRRLSRRDRVPSATGQSPGAFCHARPGRSGTSGRFPFRPYRQRYLPPILLRACLPRSTHPRGVTGPLPAFHTVALTFHGQCGHKTRAGRQLLKSPTAHLCRTLLVRERGSRATRDQGYRKTVQGQGEAQAPRFGIRLLPSPAGEERFQLHVVRQRTRNASDGIGKSPSGG